MLTFHLSDPNLPVTSSLEVSRVVGCVRRRVCVAVGRSVKNGVNVSVVAARLAVTVVPIFLCVLSRTLSWHSEHSVFPGSVWCPRVWREWAGSVYGGGGGPRLQEQRGGTQSDTGLPCAKTPTVKLRQLFLPRLWLLSEAELDLGIKRSIFEKCGCRPSTCKMVQEPETQLAIWLIEISFLFTVQPKSNITED